MLVNSENSSETSNTLLYDDPEIIHPSKDATQNIFDLMKVIFIFSLTEKFPVAYPTMHLIFLFELLAIKQLENQELKNFENNEHEDSKCQVIFLRNRLKILHLRIIGICSHLLFCAVVGPNVLWIKFYLTTVAILATLIENIDKQIDQENKKLHEKLDKKEIKSDEESNSGEENEKPVKISSFVYLFLRIVIVIFPDFVNYI
ncbi:13124_t:CDS:2 [Gigaspora margarita]|uniref:13124_t:CDS:1 n=1 Tax=Gigaspora margarita TaxID=4874 RepID=A0ABN7UH75_GIGMA|nr:13124_t:CDS:2 [Gigaspora margarita]